MPDHLYLSAVIVGIVLLPKFTCYKTHFALYKRLIEIHWYCCNNIIPLLNAANISICGEF